MTKTAADGDGVRVQLLRNPGAQHKVASAGIPELLPNVGLTDDRRAYLLQNAAGFAAHRIRHNLLPHWVEKTISKNRKSSVFYLEHAIVLRYYASNSYSDTHPKTLNFVFINLAYHNIIFIHLMFFGDPGITGNKFWENIFWTKSP